MFAFLFLVIMLIVIAVIVIFVIGSGAALITGSYERKHADELRELAIKNCAARAARGEGEVRKCAICGTEYFFERGSINVCTGCGKQWEMI